MSSAGAALVAALAVAVVAVVAMEPTTAAASALPEDQVRESNNTEWDYMLADMTWLGPEHGCDREESAGGGSDLTLKCEGGVTLSTDRNKLSLTVECEPNGDRPGMFTCERLEQVAGEMLRNHTVDALVRRAGTAGVLNALSITRCELSESLTCVLALVGADDVARVTLRGVPTPLQAQLDGLSSLTHLRILEVDKNMKHLPYRALAGLAGLRRLDVQGGSLQLQEDAWPPLPQLQMLELSSGGLRTLPARAFRNLSQLHNLSLWSNEIETIDASALQGLSQLKILVLNSNRLRILPQAVLLPVRELRVLHLYGNRLSVLPHLGHLEKLQEVWVNNDNETSLLLHNDTFANLTELRRLKLESCGVSSLPAIMLRGCRALEELSLRWNWLVELPPELLTNQNSLRVFDVAYNRLGTLPISLFTGAKNLEVLDLSNNHIYSLKEKTFLSLAALKKLNLSTNKLKELPRLVFEGLNNVEELGLSYNNLSMMGSVGVEGRDESPLANMNSLRRVTLEYNAVRQFMDDWRRLPYLETLSLSHNIISELKDVDLQLTSSATVDLRHNNISRVKQWPLKLLESAGTMLSQARFLLSDNPFYCDCNIYDFLMAVRSEKVVQQLDVGSAQCVAPPALTGKLLQAVPLDALKCALPASACPSNCTCERRADNSILELDCEYEPRELPEPKQHQARGMWLRLHSPLADVRTLPNFVQVVDLSGLHLTRPPTASVRPLNLTVNLSNNSLTSAPLDLLEANCKVLLAGNPLACDCEHQGSVAGLKRYWTRVHDRDALRCDGEEWPKGKNADALCARREALVMGLGSGLALVLLLLIAFRYRTEIRLLLGRFVLFDFLLPKKDARMLEKKYDAFVSFSHHDDEYVRNILVPELEGGRRPLRLCLHDRDWEVGDFITDQIDRSVRDSWRTIVVLSEEFVKSMWGRHEFRAALGLERVIVLVLGDALRAMDSDQELRAYKKTHTCIMASNPLVWDRIRDAVYRSKCASSVTTDEGTVGGIDVVLRNGQLVNEATMEAGKREKLPPPFCGVSDPNGNYPPKNVEDDVNRRTGLIGRWLKVVHDQNCIDLRK